MDVRIITDSGSDILPDLASEWGITVIPLTVRFGDEEFYDGVTLSREQFYNRLIESDELPKTSQITPGRYEEAFRAALDAGEEIVCLVLSADISGSWQSACIAKENIAEEDPAAAERIHLVDTQQFCGSEYIQVHWAVQLRDQGFSAAQIAEKVDAQKGHARVLALFDTLEYLKLGGRISPVAAAAGGLLSIKPVVTIEKGVVEVIGKARGSLKGNNMLNEFIEKVGGVDWGKPIVLCYTGLSRIKLDKYLKDSAHLYQDHYAAGEIPVSHVGATIGTYTGPGAIACAFYSINGDVKLAR